MLEHLPSFEIEQIEKTVAHQIQIYNSKTKDPARSHRTDKLELVETPLPGKTSSWLVHDST